MVAGPLRQRWFRIGPKLTDDIADAHFANDVWRSWALTMSFCILLKDKPGQA